MIDKGFLVDALLRAAAHNGVEVLYACESGSRAWGLASPDSDYDVRFVYRHPPEHYLSLHRKRDQIGPILERDGELDLVGWDVRKFLQHLVASNPNVLEWLGSPVTYHRTGDFFERCDELANYYFQARRTVHHYLGIARGARQAGETPEGQWNVKKACYWMRSLLAAEYTVRQQRRPPIEMKRLMAAVDNTSVREELDAFLARKARLEEKAVVSLPHSLSDYFGRMEEALASQAEDVPKREVDPQRGDEFFQSVSGWT